MKTLSLILLIIALGIWSMVAVAVFNQNTNPRQLVSLPPISPESHQPFVPASPQNESNTITAALDQAATPIASRGSAVASRTNTAGTNRATAPVTNTGIGIPKTLKIPKIGVNASFESIGLDSQDRMDVPKSWYSAGWYNLGYRVGDSGSAVVSGHYDTVSGAPAIFYRLGSLNAGDQITVTLDTGKVFTFSVTSKQSYAWDQLPLQAIFASSGAPGLNLITCAGNWDRGSRNYTQRTVVYAKMIQ